MQLVSVVSSALLLSLAVPASMAPPMQPAASNAAGRAPTGRWTVDFANARCVASRDYGTEAEPLILGLKAPAVGDVMQIVIVRRGRGSRYADQLNATLTVDGAPPISASMIAMMIGRTDRRVYTVNLTREQFNAVRSATSLSIRGGTEFRETLRLSGMDSLIRVTDQCVAGLRRDWNAQDGEQLSPALRQRARGSIQGLVRSEDYPGIAANQLAGGTVGFVILVDETGRVADCTVTQTSGVAVLDAQSCAIITARARYEPAIGIDGRPARDTIRQRITWII